MNCRKAKARDLDYGQVPPLIEGSDSEGVKDITILKSNRHFAKWHHYVKTRNDHPVAANEKTAALYFFTRIRLTSYG